MATYQHRPHSYQMRQRIYESVVIGLGVLPGCFKTTSKVFLSLYEDHLIDQTPGLENEVDALLASRYVVRYRAAMSII